jgi:predicted Zn-dependent peptidase
MKFPLAAEEIGRHLLVYGRRIPLAETYLRIQAITVDDVKRVAREYMEDVDPAVVSLGTTASVPGNQNQTFCYSLC